MAYIALYRSYRPTRFQDVIGQNHVKQTLRNAVMEDKTSHAYIFSGLRGIGKTTIARILAKAVNCKNPIDGEPCNVCESCMSIINNETTDIIELDAASNNGVDEMREILEKVNFLPSTLKKKVYIIDEAHMLSTAAFNALLKTLEEPPHYVIFILATTEPHKIPSTILSRCQRFDFKQFTKQELISELDIVIEKENLNVTNDAKDAITDAAEGGMRDALSILDQTVIYATGEVTLDDVNSVTGRISNYKLIDFINALKNKDVTTCINIVDELINMGKEVSRVVSSIIQFCRDILLYKNLTNINVYKNIYQNENFISLAESLSKEEIFYYIDSFSDVQNKIRYSNTQKIFVEVGIMKIINSVSSDIDVLGKIHKLEDTISGIGTGSVSNNVNIDVDSKINGLENKIKKISSEIEKAELEKFKESVESKLDMLEEISSKNASMPTDLNFRIDEIEDKIRVIAAENQTNASIELKEVLEKLEALEQTGVNLLENNDSDINTKITEIEEKINNILNSTNNNNDNVVENERIAILEEYVKNLSNTIDNLEFGQVVTTNTDSQELLELKDNYFVLVQAVQELKKNNNNDVYNKEQVEHLNEEINLLVSKLNEFEQKITTINSDIEKISVESSNYQNKLTSLETKIKEVANIKPNNDERKTTFEPSNSIRKETTFEKPHSDVVRVEKKEPVKRSIESNENNTLQTVRNVYDVRILERILHESRDIECREEKARLLTLWPKLEDKVGYVLASAAKILNDGKLAANGKNELLIIYPKASICNQLMEPKNYNDAKQVLRITFGKDYDFMALPENVWQEKRSEYHGQYGVGIRYPKLTPINNPELKVVVVNYDKVNNEKKPLQQVRDFFGVGKVEEER